MRLVLCVQGLQARTSLRYEFCISVHFLPWKPYTPILPIRDHHFLILNLKKAFFFCPGGAVASVKQQIKNGDLSEETTE